MYSNKGETDNLERCPYDKAHRVSSRRMAQHIVKCGRRPQDKMVTCPYTTTHVVPEVELKHHKEHCKYRLELDKFYYVPKSSDSEKIEIPDVKVQPTESWDDDTVVPTYNPQEHCERNLVLRNSMQTYSSAQRKMFRNEERQRHQQLAAAEAPKPAKRDEPYALRRPAVNKATNAKIFEDDPFTVQNLMDKVKANAGVVMVPPLKVSANEASTSRVYPVLNEAGTDDWWTPGAMAMQATATAKKRGIGRGSSLAKMQ